MNNNKAVFAMEVPRSGNFLEKPEQRKGRRCNRALIPLAIIEIKKGPMETRGYGKEKNNDSIIRNIQRV